MCAKFHFVDLAGSERANRTGNVGERFKGDLLLITVITYIHTYIQLKFDSAALTKVKSSDALQ